MKHFIRTIVATTLFLFPGYAQGEDMKNHNAYDFSFKTLMGEEPLPLTQFEGKVIMIVNTASYCGFTSQFQALEDIYNVYRESGFVVIGVPSNDFGGQEPGTNQEIATFCKANYGVTFPMASKEIVSGDNAHPFYLWARQTLGFGTAPKWNFHKYLVDRNGNLIDHFNSTTAPDSKRVKAAIEKALGEK